MTEEPIKVGMAELAAAREPAQVMSIGLGSCVGVVLLDAANKIGGVAHIMLPSADLSKDKSNPAKFADTAIVELLKKMKTLGAKQTNIRARIFGGANMFKNLIGSNGLLDMGARNVERVRQELERHRIRIVAEETGADFGRTITLDIASGKVYLRTADGQHRVY